MKIGIVLESLTNRQEFVASICSLKETENHYVIREQLSEQLISVNMPMLSIDKIYVFDGIVVCFDLEHVKKAVNSMTVKGIAYYFDSLDYVKNIDYISNIKALNDDRVFLFTPSIAYSNMLSLYVNKKNEVVPKYNIPEMVERVKNAICDR